MVIYNVTLKVDKEVVSAWVHWMKTEHMPELIRTGLFTDCRLCHLLEQDESDGVTYSAQYFCKTIQDYHRYIDKYSAEMRDKGQRLFGGKFVAFRSVMEVI